jgi:hypothetical protein
MLVPAIRLARAVRATLIDPRDDAQVWADAFDRELSDAVSMQEDISRHVGQALLARLPELRPGAAAARARSADAFEQAIAAEASFGPPYSALAQVHTVWTLFGYPGDPEPYTRVATSTPSPPGTTPSGP